MNWQGIDYIIQSENVVETRFRRLSFSLKYHRGYLVVPFYSSTTRPLAILICQEYVTI